REITMDYRRRKRMQVAKDVTNLDCKLSDDTLRLRTFNINQLLQYLAVHEFHHEISAKVLKETIEDFDNLRMDDRGKNIRLAIQCRFSVLHHRGPAVHRQNVLLQDNFRMSIDRLGRRGKIGGALPTGSDFPQDAIAALAYLHAIFQQRYSLAICRCRKI